MLLQNIIKQHELDHSVHDGLIKNTMNSTEISKNIMTIAYNAYYKIPCCKSKNGFIEGEIDLLQLLYSHKQYKEIFGYTEVPFADSTLLLYEMKSSDTVCNYKKAIKQLTKSKNMIRDFTDYYKIDCFYVFNIDNSFVVRFEQVD